MSNIKTIAPAFIAAKRAFAPLLKNRENSHFKSKYADLGACIDAVEGALLANDIAVYHEVFEDTAGVTVECVLLHSSGEMIRSGKFHVPAAKHDPQGYGSALHYARRYTLTAVCCIAPEDDDGNAACRATEKSPTPKDISCNPRKDAFESLPIDIRKSLQELSVAVENTFEQQGAAEAQWIIDENGVDDIYLVALYNLLSSKCRAALKKLTKPTQPTEIF